MTRAALFEIQLYAMAATGVIGLIQLAIAPAFPQAWQRAMLRVTAWLGLIALAIVAADVLRFWANGWRP